MTESKKPNIHKITVRCRPGEEGRITTGSNTQILLDGVPLKACKSVKFEISASKVAITTIELYGEIDLEISSVLEQSDPTPTNYKISGKPISLYTLSSPFPRVIAIEEEEIK